MPPRQDRATRPMTRAGALSAGHARSERSLTLLGGRLLCTALLAFPVLAVFACDSTDPDPLEAIASVTVTPPSVQVDIGATTQLVAQVLNGRGEQVTANVTWSTSSTATATVSGSGLVTGIAEGATTIVAAVGSQVGTAAVTVTDPNPPQQPSGIQATPVSDTEIVVIWTDTSTNEDEFVIERAGGDGSGASERSAQDFIEVGRVGPNVTSFRDTGLIAATSYRYRVTACNENGCPDPLETDEEVATYETLIIETTSLPGSPLSVPYDESLVAIGGDGAFTWDVTGGSLPEGLSLSSEGRVSGSPTATGTSSFTVRVRSADQETTVGLSITVTVTTALPPPTPAEFGGNAVSGSVFLMWQDGPNEAAYELDRALAPEGAPVFDRFVLPNQDAGSTTYVDTGVTPATRYQYRIRACNEAGCSDYSTIYITTAGAGPPAPSATTEAGRGFWRGGSTGFKWVEGSANPNSVPTTVWYEHGLSADLSDAEETEHRSIGSDRNQVAVDDTISFPHQDPVIVYYRLVASSVGGTTYGETKSVDYGTPPVPTDVTAELLATPGHIVRLTYDYVSGFAGRQINRLAVERRTGGEPFEPIDTISHSVPFQYDDVTFDVRVDAFDWGLKACNRVGCSSAGTVGLSGTELAPPSDLAITDDTPGNVALTWSENANTEVGIHLVRSDEFGNSETIGLPADATTYTDQDAVTGVEYTYRVHANATGAGGARRSDPSASVSIVP